MLSVAVRRLSRSRSLLATLVVMASALALLVSSFRVTDAVLGVAFARACAAEAASVEPGTRARLRVTEEDIELTKTPALAAPAEVAKLHQPSERSGSPPAFVASVVVDVAANVATPSEEILAGWSRAASDPPTRSRARLMVFLN